MPTHPSRFAFSAETNSTPPPSSAAFARDFSSVNSSERPFFRTKSVTQLFSRRVTTIVPLPSGFSRITLRSWRQPVRSRTAGARLRTRMHRLLMDIDGSDGSARDSFRLLQAEREEVLDLPAGVPDALFGLGHLRLGRAAVLDVSLFLIERLGLGSLSLLLDLLARLVELLHRLVEIRERGGDQVAPRLFASGPGPGVRRVGAERAVVELESLAPVAARDDLVA